MKRITETIQKRWPEYILESMVIVASILLAIWLENLNADRLERKEEKEILLRVKNDLTNTISEFEFLNELRAYVLQATKGIYAIKANGDYTKPKIDSLLGATFFKPTFNNKMGAIELLFTSGKINLIQNEEIKERLLAWPGTIDDMTEEEIFANEVLHDHYYPTLTEYVYIHDFVGKAMTTSYFGAKVSEPEYPDVKTENDYEGLLSDPQFLNHLYMRATFMKVTVDECEELIAQANEIIDLIDVRLRVL